MNQKTEVEVLPSSKLQTQNGKGSQSTGAVCHPIAQSTHSPTHPHISFKNKALPHISEEAAVVGGP